MSAIALRSPQYKFAAADVGTPLSAKLTLSIDGTIEYTLVKPTTLNENMLWEIAELCRDFIDVTFNGTYTAETLAIISTLTSHASTDGSGTALTTDTFTDVGYDAYGTFMEGDNPTVPFGSRPTWLVGGNPFHTGINDEYYIYVPTGAAGSVPYISATEVLGYSTYNTTDVELVGTPAGIKMNIVRIDCTKYDYGHKITFVNKFGALQDLWFFLKSVNTTTKKQEQFQRNIVTSTGTYNVNTHTKQDFNTIANTNISLSSGFYPEWCNQWFEQLLLSEQVWLTRSVLINPTADEVVPVNVTKSSMVKKTVLNDNLIEYTFDFSMSFDYINNVR
tara:strand:- start:14 stop:1012 length:999 start_codon:yes stop_codon:yes gene_type:complete